MTIKEIEIRECVTPQELSDCVRIQREVFELPEVEISPVRHFVVTRHAGGFTLGAFCEGKLVGFVLSVLAFNGNEKIFYSHMTAIAANFQNYGIGAKLKWAQRSYALEEGVKSIKWTFQPVFARNAFFNLEKLGAIVSEYQPNFYGTDYGVFDGDKSLGIASDRLFAEWNLENEKVRKFAVRDRFEEKQEVVKTIETFNNWNDLLKSDVKKAALKQDRIRYEFQEAFNDGLVCRGFKRDLQNPKFLLY